MPPERASPIPLPKPPDIQSIHTEANTRTIEKIKTGSIKAAHNFIDYIERKRIADPQFLTTGIQAIIDQYAKGMCSGQIAAFIGTTLYHGQNGFKKSLVEALPYLKDALELDQFYVATLIGDIYVNPTFEGFSLQKAQEYYELGNKNQIVPCSIKLAGLYLDSPSIQNHELGLALIDIILTKKDLQIPEKLAALSARAIFHYSQKEFLESLCISEEILDIFYRTRFSLNKDDFLKELVAPANYIIGFVHKYALVPRYNNKDAAREFLKDAAPYVPQAKTELANFD